MLQSYSSFFSPQVNIEFHLCHCRVFSFWEAAHKSWPRTPRKGEIYWKVISTWINTWKVSRVTTHTNSYRLLGSKRLLFCQDCGCYQCNAVSTSRKTHKSVASRSRLWQYHWLNHFKNLILKHSQSALAESKYKEATTWGEKMPCLKYIERHSIYLDEWCGLIFLSNSEHERKPKKRKSNWIAI